MNTCVCFIDVLYYLSIESDHPVSPENPRKSRPISTVRAQEEKIEPRCQPRCTVATARWLMKPLLTQLWTTVSTNPHCTHNTTLLLTKHSSIWAVSTVRYAVCVCWRQEYQTFPLNAVTFDVFARHTYV